MSDSGYRRRIDRITDPAYLDGVSERPAAELRAMRDECRDEESELSYMRRLLHGKLDILAAERERRAHGEHPSQLVERLTDILADSSTGRRAPAHTTALYEPRPEGRRRSDHVLDELPLAKVPDLADDELDELVATLKSEERAVSERRAVVLAAFDTLQAELVGRYRTDADALGEVVSRADANPT